MEEGIFLCIYRAESLRCRIAMEFKEMKVYRSFFRGMLPLRGGHVFFGPVPIYSGFQERSWPRIAAPLVAKKPGRFLAPPSYLRVNNAAV